MTVATQHGCPTPFGRPKVTDFSSFNLPFLRFFFLWLTALCALGDTYVEDASWMKRNHRVDEILLLCHEILNKVAELRCSFGGWKNSFKRGYKKLNTLFAKSGHAEGRRQKISESEGLFQLISLYLQVVTPKRLPPCTTEGKEGDFDEDKTNATNHQCTRQAVVACPTHRDGRIELYARFVFRRLTQTDGAGDSAACGADTERRW